MRSRIHYTPEELAELLAKPTMTMSEAAAVAGVGRTNFVNALRRGEISLPIISIGTRKVVPTVAVRQLIGMAPERPTPPLDNGLTEARGSVGIRDGKVVWKR